MTNRPKLKRSPFHDISPAIEKNTPLDYLVLLSGEFWWTEFELLTHFKKLHQTLEFFFPSGIQILRSGLKTVNPSAALRLLSVSFSVFGYRYPHETLLGAKRNRYLVFHKSHRHLSAFNNNKHTDLASWKSNKSTYFVNSLLLFFSFISSLERFSQFSYLVKTTVIAVVLQTNQIQHRMNEWCRHTAVNNLAKFL